MAVQNSTKKSKLRRDQVRRQRSGTRESALKRLRDRIGLLPSAIGLGFIVIASAIMLYGQEPFPYSPGQEVHGPICARVKFDIPDEDATRELRQMAREGTPNYFLLNNELVSRIRGIISNLYNASQQHETYEAYLEAKEDADEQSQQNLVWRLSADAFGELHALAGEEGKEIFTSWLDRLENSLKKQRLVRVGDDKVRTVEAKSSIAILKGAIPNPNERTVDSETPGEVEVATINLEYFGEDNLKNVTRSAISLARDQGIFPATLQSTIQEILSSALREEPLFQFDLKRTEERMAEEAAGRLRVKTPYSAFAVLTEPTADGPDASRDQQASATEQAGGRYRLDNQQIALLKHEHAKHVQLLTAPLESLAKDDNSLAVALREQDRFRRVGLVAAVVLISLGMIAYCGMFQPRVIQNPVRAFSVGLLLLTMMAVSRLLFLGEFAVRFPLIVVSPVVMTAAVLTMVYSQRFAFGITAGLAVLITLTVRGDISMLLVLTAAMAVAIYQLREIRNRNELFSTGLLNALAAFLMALTMGLVGGYSIEAVIPQAGMAAGAALVTVAMFIMFLSPIERIFKVATNWTLLELLDTSRPLLVRLAREAPGTFAHSLWLSNLAESACEALGAHALLAKVGAMYHDIGKVHKPEYFTENQEANINLHDNLAPTMSLLVIVAHVKDGVELAKEEGLPPALIRFIEEHHGTTVVRYFHHAASEKQKAAGDRREVSETEFRYPGPKPQSRETAVLMLCDGVEGAVRALHEPTAGRIETVVHNILMDRLNDGQFDDCDITLKELHLIEESLVKSLCRFYHGRVTYPKMETAKTGTQ